MKIHKILAVCLSMLLFAASGCGALDGEKATSSGDASAVSRVSTTSQRDFLSSHPETVSFAESASSMSSSSKPICSGPSSSENTSSSPSVSSKMDQSNREWVAYDTNKDRYKLHIKRKDGNEDHVILNDVVLAPCVAGEWVYYIAPLREIDKVKLDGSKKTKVCTVDAMDALNANTAVSAVYKDGYILYKLFQLREVGDSRPHTVTYYKLDLFRSKITEVTNQLSSGLK